MDYPKEYLEYLIHFHCDRDYFECHEVLEEYWKKTDPGNRSSVWVGLIQVAVGFYHYRRENRNGASRTLAKGMKILEGHSESLINLGIDPKKLQTSLEHTLQNIHSGSVYQSIDLPIIDKLQQYCEANGRTISSGLDIPNEIIHRHTLRDRSEVIELREKELHLRRKRRED